MNVWQICITDTVRSVSKHYYSLVPVAISYVVHSSLHSVEVSDYKLINK